MKPKKLILFAILIILVVFAIFGFKYIFDSDCEEKYSVTKVVSISGLKIEIKADSCWEATQGIYCMVAKGESDVFPLAYIGSTLTKTDSLHFNLVENEDSGIIAIVEQSNPDVILGIFDFKKMQFWPSHKNVNYLDERKIGVNLLNELQKAHATQTFYLNSEINREGLKVR